MIVFVDNLYPIHRVIYDLATYSHLFDRGDC